MLRRMLAQLLASLRASNSTTVSDVDVSLTRALELQRSGAPLQAEHMYRRLIERDASDVDAMHLLGALLVGQGQLEEGERLLERVTVLDPNRATAHFHLASALHGLNEMEGAVQSYQRAISLKPEFSAAYVNCGVVLQQRGDLAAAIEHFLKAIDLEPENAEAHYGLARALYQRGNTLEAITAYQRALKQRPGSADFHYGYAMASLRLGHYEVGWQEYEWRFDQRGDVPLRRPYDYPRWRGEFSENRVILVWGEQGLGDEIMFASCLPDLIAAGQRLLIECSPKLEKLFRRSFPTATVFATAKKAVLPDHVNESSIEAQSAMGSLAQYVRRSADSFPSHSGYLQADTALVGKWRSRLDALGPGIKVGISWQGGTPKTHQAARSIPLARWLPILRLPGVHFVSLQYTDAHVELAAIESLSGVAIADFVETHADYDQTAALVSGLDLVISVCTTVVHLGGALGRPVWVMAPYSPEWRYGIAGERMPWYPSVRIFRQPAYGAWDPVIEVVARELRNVSLFK